MDTSSTLLLLSLRTDTLSTVDASLGVESINKIFSIIARDYIYISKKLKNYLNFGKPTAAAENEYA